MKIDIEAVRREIANLQAAFPEIDDPEEWSISLSSETTLDETLAALVDRLGRDEELVTGASARVREIQARKARIDARIDATRALIKRLMDMAGVSKREIAEATLSVKAGRPRVIVTDADVLPDAVCKIERKPDLTKIGEALKAGDLVTGAVLSNPEQTLTIRRT